MPRKKVKPEDESGEMAGEPGGQEIPVRIKIFRQETEAGNEIGEGLMEPTEHDDEIFESEEDMEDLEGFDGEEFPAEVTLVDRSALCNVCADYVELNESAVISANADTVGMNNSAAVVLVADSIEAENSRTVLLIAREVEGEVQTVFTPMTAAIFGGAIGVTVFLLSQIFRSFRR